MKTNSKTMAFAFFLLLAFVAGPRIAVGVRVHNVDDGDILSSLGSAPSPTYQSVGAAAQYGKEYMDVFDKGATPSEQACKALVDLPSAGRYALAQYLGVPSGMIRILEIVCDVHALAPYPSL